MKSKSKSNPLLRYSLALAASVISAASAYGQTYYFDVNDTTGGSGVTDAGSYDWLGAFWADDNTGTATTSTKSWGGTSNNVVFASTADVGSNSYTVTLPGGYAQTWVKDLTVNSGNLSISNGFQANFVLGANSTWTVATGSSLSINSSGLDWRAVNMNLNSLILDIQGSASATIAGLNNSDGTVTKNGTGTLTLSAANSYGGLTTVSSGTLKVTGQNYLPGSGGITIGLNATLMTDAPNDDNTQSITSTTTLNGGTLAAGTGTPAQNFNSGNPVGPWGNFHLANGASLQAGGASTSAISASLGLGTGVNPINVDGGSTLNISGDIFGVSYVAYGQFSKSGDGTLVLGGNNKSASQGMILSAGTVEFSTNSLPTNLRATDGPEGYSADIQGNATLRWATGNIVDISFENDRSQVKIGDGVTATFDTNGNNVTLGTAFDLGASQTGALTKAGSGTLTLSAANSYTGPTTVSVGTLSLSSAYLNDASTVSIANGAVLNLTHGLTDVVGSLVIDGTPLGSGTYTASSPATTGYITGTGSIQVVATDPFLAWIDSFFPGETDPLIIGATADPDNDGIENLVEYVLKNGDPDASSTGILPTANASGANLVFTYLRRTDATGTTQTFQYGNDLSGWTDVPVIDGGIVSITSPEAGIEQVVITVAKGVETKLFGRLQVVK